MPHPIFIAAPVRRSGTTLLQRLCSASGEALVFGESAANDLLAAGSMFQYKQYTFSYNAEWRDKQLSEVLAGGVNQWIPDLLPPIDAYVGIHEELLHGLCEGFARAAEALGRPRWGVKLPEWPTQSLVFWQQLLPESKTVYLVREYPQCLASARKMEMVINEQDEARFHQSYEHNLAQARAHLRSDQTYFLNYDKLCDKRAAGELELLAAFLGLRELPLSVLKVRVGDYT